MKQLKKTALHGDLFCVPAIDKTEKHGFVIGRFIETTPENLGYLIEIFKKFYVTPPSSLKDVDRSERLFRPILTSLSFVNIPRWHVILHDPDYEKSQSEYNNIGFAFNTVLWLGGKDAPLPRNSDELYEPPTNWSPIQVIWRACLHLKGIFQADDVFEFTKIPQNMRINNPDISLKLIALAHEIDHLLIKHVKK